MRGIDISNWQKGLKPSNLDIDFCIVKATEGLGYTDPSCDSFVQDCISNDILWGFYHFARENDPVKEAEFFYAECKNYFNHGIPVLDYETQNYNNVAWCEKFIKRLYDLSGVWCLLYTSASWCGQFEGSWIPDKCGLWVAGYPYTMNNWTDQDMPYNTYPFNVVAIWQFTSTLNLNGYNGNLDGDIAYMNKDAWLKYAKCNSKSEKVQPTLNYYDLAVEIILGEWGNGDDRKRMLEKAGYDYQTAQDIVNNSYKLALETIDGKWGNGWNRENALGAYYKPTQTFVNKILEAK